MNLSIGIVGLPNAGKSTLFNALLKKQLADNSNYPFCTIEPNIGVVAVPDERLPQLAEVVKTNQIVAATVEFVDIAGLVKGAHQGEGLGNKFLSHIRQVNVICHVVRFFKDDNVVHVANRLDPQADVEIVNSELILADLQTLDKQLEPKGKVDPETVYLWSAVQKLQPALNQGQLAIEVELSDEEAQAAKSLCLLTAKPVIYIANLNENNLSENLNDSGLKPIIKLSAQMEAEIAALNQTDQQEYLISLGLKQSGLNRLIKLTYETLGLISFLTAGVKEVRAWTVRQGASAKEAAGVIHTDFSDKFIKADVVSFEDFVKYDGWQNCRNLGKVRSEGKDYIMKNGDVVEFKIGH